ncbi:GHKL domain-containing protein [Bacillus sp. FJAT-49736]|nr:GHKL domain-containing protein [Bacillus sp. FJAT-49736]
MGVRWNGFLFVLQICLVVLYGFLPPSWVHIVPFLVFIGMEIVREYLGKKISMLEHSVMEFEAQREHINETFRIVRSERHDFLKHVSALHFMLENEKSQEAKAYLDELVDGYKETNLSIKGERGVVAAILHQMYRRAKAVGIDIIYDLDLPLSTIPIADQDMVTLLGNLLSNSIDACEEWQKTQHKQAQLSLQMYKRSGLYILICKNNSMPIPLEILDDLFHSFGKTTKGDGHEGLGTKIILDVVQAHQGFLDFVFKEQEFTVKIKIPAIR